ncbi:MAG TPA: cytochrome c biogenesis CcdA family protein [Candidatus Binatia bacterium]
MTEIGFFVAFTSGLLSFLSPCVFPVIPSYLSFISGVSVDEMTEPAGESLVRRRVVLNSLAFILGFSIVFVSLGLSASFLGGLFAGYRQTIRIAGGALIMLVGIYLLGFIKIPALDRYFQMNFKDKPAGYLGSALIGVTFAVAWIPCVGPILGAILTWAATSRPVEGSFLLASYAAGLAVPFFLSAMAINSFFHFSKKFRRYIHLVHVAAGVLLVVVGALLVTDYFTRLNIYVIRFTPLWLYRWL